MNMRSVATVVGLAILAGGQSPPAAQFAPPQQSTSFPPAPAAPPEVYRPYTLPASDIEVVKRYVTESLKDPGSAKFGNIVGSISEKGVASACGYVNATNSYGGYVGQTPFIGVLATNTSGQRVFAVRGMGGTSNETTAVMMLCQREGIAI